MRTLLAALALALALPASPAAACGGDDHEVARPVAAARHVVRGTVGSGGRNDAGTLVVFIAYPDVDGARSGLYGMFVELREDVASRRLERALARWETTGPRTIVIEVARTGETGPWRLVSSRR